VIIPLRLEFEARLSSRELEADSMSLLIPMPTFKVPLNIPYGQNMTKHSVPGGHITKQTIVVKGAAGLTLVLNNLKLAKGSLMIVYNESKDFLIGPIDGDRFHSVSSYITETIPGEEVHIEVFIPDNSGEVNYFLSSVFFHTQPEDELAQIRSGTWDPCYVNSVCPAGEPFANQRESVVRIQAFHPSLGLPTTWDWGSGVLVGNTANDFEPYILTARHLIDKNLDGTICSDEIEILGSMKFLFFHENTTCSHPALPPSPTTAWSFTNASLIAENASTDMVLLKINNATLDTRYYFAGWKANVHLPGEIYSLSHPEGLKMKISKSDNPGTNSSSFTTAGVNIPAHYAYKVQWDLGCVDNGSSGGPYFDSNGFVVGTHTGGKSTLFGPRYYGGRLSHAWSAFGQILDPISSGANQAHTGGRNHSISGPEIICEPGTYQFEYHSSGIDPNDISWTVQALGASGTGPVANIQVTGNEEPGRWWITFSSPRQNGGEIRLNKTFILSGLDLSPYTTISMFDENDNPVPKENGAFLLDYDTEYRLYTTTHTGSPFYTPATNWNWNIPFDWDLLSLDPSSHEIRIKTPDEASPLMLRWGDPVTVDIYDGYCQTWNYSAGWAQYVYNEPEPEGFVFIFSPNPVKNELHIRRVSKEMAANQSWIVLEAGKSGMKLSNDEYLVRILNERGLFFEKRYRTDEFSLDLSSFSEGTYFIHVLVGETVFRGKFIKERQEFKVSQSGQK
jgi:hypothetical protein